MGCEAIDNILKFLQQLENQGQLSTTAKNQIQSIKFVLRYIRIHSKWEKPRFGVMQYMQTWLEDVEMRLIQPTRNGRMAPDVLEEALSSLLQNNDQLKERLVRHPDHYYRVESYRREHGFKDVQIDELVTDWLNPLLANLRHLIHCNDPNLPVSRKEQVKVLQEKLISLRNFLKISGKELERIKSIALMQGLLHKPSQDLLTRARFFIENATYLSLETWLQLQRFNMDKLFLDLLAKMNHIEPEIMVYVQFFKASKAEIPIYLGIDPRGINLRALLSVKSLLGNLEGMLNDQDNRSIIPLDAKQLAFLHQELSFLRYFLMDPHLKQYTEPKLESFTSLLMQLEAMAKKGASLTQSISDGRKGDKMVEEMNLVHSNLLEIVSLLKAKIRQMYLKVPKPSTSNFPRTPKLGFLEFLVKNLEELLKHGPDLIAYVKNEIETVQSELACLSSFIRDTVGNPEEDENIARDILDAAYEAERVIDLISGSRFPSWYNMLWLFDVIEKIKLLRKEFTDMCSKKHSDISMTNNMEKVSIQARPQAYTVAPEEEMVGFNDEAEKIINQLTGGPQELDIVSIVGMPGLGKTTIAKKVYGHPSVTTHFHVRSWYCISQVYERRDLLLSILGDVIELTDKIQKMGDEDIAAVLYRSLKGRRYFIVIDDIWSIKPWVDIHHSFPNDCNGSRILFTSRIREAALQANPRTTAPHDLRLFSKDESWELLKKKVFQGRNCPRELYDIGERIAENCKGLPLSVVVIAGILSRMEESKDCWGGISESLGKRVGDSRECTDILELSYKHLPDHLKPCFLYLGVFPEDSEISARKLIRLWVAEGLVRKTESESMEEVAEGYLQDLIARSLVLVAKNKSIGGIKSCRLHDLLHEFCVEKAKEEKVLMLSNQLVNPEQYRHCFYCKHDGLYRWTPNDPYVRSVLCFPTDRADSYDYTDLSVLPYILRLLRVLDLERVYCYEFLPEIGLLVHLRYLATRGPINDLPSSVGNIWRLETLIVHGTRGQVTLPETLLEMAYLKHVYVNKRASFELSDTFKPEKSSISGLQNLSTLAFCGGHDITRKLIRSLRNIKKLKCIFFESWVSYRRCNRLPVLDSLSELESLNVTYHGIVKLPYEFSFPSHLKKLTLTKFRFPWSEISKIGRLVPQLQVLKLLFRASEGPRWDVSDDEFLNLKVLKLESLDIVEWDVSCDAFPCLEQLVLERCKKLQEIRSNFGELATLRRIEVQWCSHSATKAVCEIQEQQQELGGDGIKVLIQPSDWDSASAS